MIDADSFEERVRATAALLWNRPAEKDRIAGVNLDCVLKIHSGHWVIVEITTEHTLDKVRGDINRLSMVRLAKFTNDQVVSDCYLVMFRPPTQSMIDAGKELHIRVRSYRRFERSFFDYASYAVERHKLQFGSAVHPLTGEPDNSEYVPVAYRFDKKGTDDGISRLLDLIRRGKKIVLLGEYGSGKSRCLRELFSRLTFDSQPPPEYYFLAIDLRRAWGLQSANEIIRRHLEELGLAASGDRVIRAANAGRVCFLLDGFDELGSQAWSDNALRLQNIRFEALKGIRELIGKNKGGMLICGREHYFNSQDELYRSLDLSPGETEVVRCNDEFSEDEMERFLESLGVLVDVPGWLPKRPLMCQAIANLEPQDLIRMFDEDGGDVEFWHKFMSIVSERESRIRSSLDPKTIVLVLQELAHMTRAKPANVGPLSLAEIQRAFERILGHEPVEGASTMLQRLPGLGRTEVESDDRKFIDIYIVDGLRALGVGRSISQNDYGITKEPWTNPLGQLGQRLLAREIEHGPSPQVYRNFAERGLHDGNYILASDIVASSLRRNIPQVDFGGLTLVDGHITELDLSLAEPNRLAITQSIIEKLIFPTHPIGGVTISKCIIDEGFGISDEYGLPDWITETEVTHFDSIFNVSSIKNVRLSIQHRILVTILKKTFFQKGSGRQEEALLRGLGQIDQAAQTPKILGYLVTNGILEKTRGDHGNLYIPVLKYRGRVGEILSELNMSKDDIWSWVGAL